MRRVQCGTAEALPAAENGMLLKPDQAELFFRLHRALMCFVNQRERIVPGIDDPDVFSGLPIRVRAEVRDAYLEKPGLLEEFVRANSSPQ